jgi:hypothetical protein
MQRITFKTYLPPASFCPRLKFLKDGVEFADFSMEIWDDLTFVAPPWFPIKGPEFTKEEANNEILQMLKNELNDPELDDELDALRWQGLTN